MTGRTIEELKAADDFRQSLLDMADEHRGVAPLWHGWAIVDAFLAGMDYARQKSVG